MPSVSRAQHAFSAMSTTAKGRAALIASGRKPMPVSVGKDFINADRGKHFPKRRSTAADIGRTK